MPAVPRPPFALPILPLAGLVLALYLGGCALLGWKVGGAIPGWYEGKALAGPLWLGAGLSGLAMWMFAGSAVRSLIRYHRNGGRLRVRDWLPLGATVTMGIAGL